MKRLAIKGYLLVLFCGVLSTAVNAQPFRSAWFLEGVSTRHRMNPAFMSERNYISVPGLGNAGIAAQGNVGLTDFIYRYDDPSGEYELTTFMSSTVGRDEFLDKLHDVNRLQMNADVTLLGVGFYGWNGFNTIELVSRSDMDTNLPYELFNFMKTGMDNPGGNDYQIRNIRSISESYAELAFGHAHAITRKLTIGAKLKILFAGAYADAHVRQLDVTMDQDQWKVIANGTILGSMKGASFKTEDDGKGNHIKGFDVDGSGLNGWGLAADMGIDYQLSPDLAISGALTDLGFISWRDMLRGATLNEPYYFDGFEHIDADENDQESSNDFDEQLEALGDDLGDLAKFYDQGNTGGERRMIAANLNLGAEYTLPFYRRLSAGFLWTTRFHKLNTWTEARLSANMAPTAWFDFSVNYGVSNLATSLGWIFNFHPRGVNFFIGSDQMLLKINSQGIPLNNMNAGILAGMNITFGQVRSR
ncbi:MAG: DUF5723 family protein [Prolixibacteraceae bacterium]